MKEEAEAIFGPMDNKIQELTATNLKLEKKIKIYKEDIKVLKSQLSSIEGELEEMSVRGIKLPSRSQTKLTQTKTTLLNNFEQQLEDRENEIKMLTTQNRNLETDLRHLERKLKVGGLKMSPRSPESESLASGRDSSQIHPNSFYRWHASMPQQAGKADQYVPLTNHLRSRQRSPLDDMTESLNRPTDDNLAAIDKFKSVIFAEQVMNTFETKLDTMHKRLRKH